MLKPGDSESIYLTLEPDHEKWKAIFKHLANANTSRD